MTSDVFGSFLTNLIYQPYSDTLLYIKLYISLFTYDIGSGVSFKLVCFDFISTNVGSSVIGTRTSNGFDDINY